MSRPGARKTVERPTAPLPCPAGESPFLIKGIAYRGFAQLVEKRVPGGLPEVVRQAGDASLAAFVGQTFLASSRYDALPVVPLYRIVADALGEGYDAFVTDVAAKQARFDAKTVFKLMFSDMTPADMVERIPRFGAQYYTFGTWRAHTPAPHVMITEWAGLPTYLAPWYAPMHLGHCSECFRLCGAKNVEGRVVEVVPSGRVQGFPVSIARAEFRWS